LSVDTCICGDIVDVLPLAQSTVSRHLKELKNAKLIKGTIEGNTICYCIDENTIEELQKYFINISAKLTLKNNNCCLPLNNNKMKLSQVKALLPTLENVTFKLE